MKFTVLAQNNEIPETQHDLDSVRLDHRRNLVSVVVEVVVVVVVARLGAALSKQAPAS
jgi:hypothetical protein